MALSPTGSSVFHQSLMETLLLADHGFPKGFCDRLLFRDAGKVHDSTKAVTQYRVLQDAEMTMT